MKSKGFVASLVMVLLLGVLTACAQSGSTNGGANGGGTTSSSPGSDEAARSNERVTLRVGIFDRGNSPAGMTATNNFWTNWIQENFGDPNNIHVEFVPIPRTDATEKVNVMMASGDAPDIVFASTSMLLPYNYAQQGGLKDLTQLIEEYGPNLQRYLEVSLPYGKFDGVQYAIPGRRVMTGKYEYLIRQDWLDKLGLPQPQTTEELYETLKAFKQQDPGETNGSVIPYGFSLRASSIEPIVWGFVEELTEEDRYVRSQPIGYPILFDGHKEAFRFLNQLYNEGLMSPDFALDKDGKAMFQDVMTGKVGFYSEDLGNSYYDNPGIATVLGHNISGASLEPVDPITNSVGKRTKPEYVPTGFYIMMPERSERGVEAIQYLDWLASEDVLFTIMNGFEGEDYELVDGIPQRIESEETKNRLYNSGDVAIFTIGQDYGSWEKNLQAIAATVSEPFRESIKKAYEISMKDAVVYTHFDHPIEAEVKYSSTLGSKYSELAVQSIMANPQDFDATYDRMLADYMASGGEEVLQERTEAYEAMKNRAE